MQEIDYFDAVAGKIVGGLIRYLLLLTLGTISTLTFLAATIATVASVRSGSDGVADLGGLLPFVLVGGIILAISIILRIFRIEPMAIIRQALGTMRSELVLSAVALVSVYILVFH